MKRALVTGATGFLGRRLCAALQAQGVRVDAVVRAAPRGPAPFTPRRHDGTMRSMSRIVAQARPDAAFHLAALASYDHAENDVDALLDANLRLGVHLAEACARRGRGVLVSAGTYWQHAGGTARYEPVSLYAAMKQGFQDIAAYYAAATPLRVATVQLCDVYGPGDPRGKVLGQLDAARAAGCPLKLSPGRQLVDLIHVDDAAAALIRAARALRSAPALSGSVWTVSSRRRRTLREIVAAYAQAAGKVEVIWGGRPYREREVMRPWRGPSVPGWKPRVGLTEGLADCAAARTS